MSRKWPLSCLANSGFLPSYCSLQPPKWAYLPATPNLSLSFPLNRLGLGASLLRLLAALRGVMFDKLHFTWLCKVVKDRHTHPPPALLPQCCLQLPGNKAERRGLSSHQHQPQAWPAENQSQPHRTHHTPLFLANCEPGMCVLTLGEPELAWTAAPTHPLGGLAELACLGEQLAC